MFGLPAGARAVPPVRSHVQVVAHPDDDILFMNPDLRAAIRSGASVTTIYLTAGESDVVPAEPYAARRQAGTRAAYASMAGVPDEWNRTELALSPQRSVEVHSPRALPSVRLVWVNLPDDNDPRAQGGKHALSRLWQDERAVVHTLVPTGSPVRGPSTYDRGALIAVLAQLYARFRPTVLRTQDPQPDARYQSQWPGHNHPDHIATAHFAGAALRRHDPGGMAVHVLNYRDYNIADAPANLPARVVAEKRRDFAAYAAHDPVVSMGDPYATWLRSMRPRWGRSGSWTAIDRAGRPVWAHVRGGRLFLGERELSTRGFVPAAGSPAMATDGSGRLVLVVQAETSGRVLLRREDDSERWQDGWVDLGAPSVFQGVTHVGPPAVVVAPDGAIVVAVKNGRGRVSVRSDRSITWSDIGGAEVADEVSVVVDSSGITHVFALEGTRLLHWRGTPGGRFEAVATTPHGQRPAGRIAVARGYVAFREADTGRVVVLAEHAGWGAVASLEAAAVSNLRWPPSEITWSSRCAVLPVAQRCSPSRAGGCAAMSSRGTPLTAPRSRRTAGTW
ncbi:PIG-L family deacetylase [Saccharopolyspora spinosporotrichia]